MWMKLKVFLHPCICSRDEDDTGRGGGGGGCGLVYILLLAEIPPSPEDDAKDVHSWNVRWKYELG